MDTGYLGKNERKINLEINTHRGKTFTPLLKKLVKEYLENYEVPK